MKMKKTKHGFSFKAENSEDSKLLGKLVLEMSKKDNDQPGVTATGTPHIAGQSPYFCHVCGRNPCYCAGVGM